MPADDSPQEPTAEGDARDLRGEVRWLLIAAAVFLFALTSLFAPMIGVDPTTDVAIQRVEPGEKGLGDWTELNLSDLRFVAAVLSENARKLVSDPGDVFALGQCFPHPRALALGEPLLAPALLGAPVVFFGEPVLTFNFILLMATLIAAFAMYWLVRDWTGLPAAGIVAGVLYAFHTTRMRDPVHFFVWDNAWTLLALLFARRLFAAPSWMSAIGLAFCCIMQVTGSFYPALAAVLIALPMLIWFLITYGLRRVQWAKWLAVVALLGGTAWLVFSPYLELRSEGELGARTAHIFMPLEWLLPGTMFFPGYIVYALVFAAFVWRGGADTRKLEGDPRWALLCAGLLCLLLGSGGTLEGGWRPPPDKDGTGMNLWWWVAEIVPGLEVVRSPGALISGVHAVLCILAGLGAATLIRRIPEKWSHAGVAALIAWSLIDVFQPRWLGLTPRHDYEIATLRPDQAKVDFFETLEVKGNTGPLYEISFPRRLRQDTTEPLLLGTFHRRPTSVCYNSFVISDAADLWSGVDEPTTLARLSGMGFTTLVIHGLEINDEARDLSQRIRRLRRRTGNRYLVPLHAQGRTRAWAITGASAQEGPRSGPAVPLPGWPEESATDR